MNGIFPLRRLALTFPPFAFLKAFFFTARTSSVFNCFLQEGAVPDFLFFALELRAVFGLAATFLLPGGRPGFHLTIAASSTSVALTKLSTGPNLDVTGLLGRLVGDFFSYRRKEAGSLSREFEL